MGIRSVILGLLAVTAVLPAVAHAGTVTFDFAGTMDSATGLWSGQGSAVTGSYSYDDSLIDLSPGDGTEDRFQSDTLGQAVGVWDITVTLGAITRSTSSNAQNTGTLHHGLQFLDGPGEDRFFLQALGVSTGDDEVGILLRDFIPGVPDGIAGGSGSLTGSPLTTPLDPSLFSLTASQSGYLIRDASGNNDGWLQFTVTSISRASIVPLPSPLLLALVGLALLPILRRRGR